MDGNSTAKPLGYSFNRGLLVLQMIACSAAFIFIVAINANRIVGETLGFASAWSLGYPIARRTYAPNVPLSRYLLAGLAGTAVGLAGRLLMMRI